MAMSDSERSLILTNMGAARRAVDYVVTHASTPGNTALTFAAFRDGPMQGVGVSDGTLAAILVALKAGVDSLQSA